MTKYFCDRCGKEIDNKETMFAAQVPTKRRGASFETTSIAICPSCRKEYDAIIDTLTDIRFIMFDKFFILKGE